MDRRTFARRLAAMLGLAVTSDSLFAAIAGADDSSASAESMSSDIVLHESFEGEIPDLHTYHARYAAETTHAHTGQRSLHVVSTNGSGGAYFRLDDLVDLDSDCAFSAWVYVREDSGARLYISVSDGERRQTRAQATAESRPGGEAGGWVKLTGTLRGEEWEETDSEVMLAMVTSGECWFDDVVLRRIELPRPPIETYPALSRTMRGRADETAVTLSPGATITLTATEGVLAADFGATEVERPRESAVTLPPDGMLLFAVDAPRAMYVTGALRLAPDSDVRPGLRAYVMCDDTVVATPMVRADAWEGVGPRALTGAAPDISGARPPVEVELERWFMPRGRHYILIAAPHFRPGGRFESLRIRALDRAVEKPLYEFGLLADTHFASGRSTWMNHKLTGPARDELPATLASLQADGTRFAIIAGDMTDSATRPQFESVGRVCREAGLPVYGCIGNHDAYHASSRPDALELCAEMFPGGATDYVLEQPPLRFIVLDGSYWRDRDGVFTDYRDPETSVGIGARPEQVEWLRRTLAADEDSPTLFVWHYPLHAREGLSRCGYRMPAWEWGADVHDVLMQAPNVAGVLCGHTHWNELNVHEGLTHVVNPAYCEWPNAYRLFRVYRDRMEWELRQVSNRGFVRESFATSKALSWMISTGDGDLGGEIPL